MLQPRVTPALPPAREGSLFQRIFSGPPGIDPYASAVSDVYQDLFGEGIYTGKGIYDVDAFEAALAGRVPENALLSHDLFEGIFARAGLVTDIELFEEFPAHYEVAAARQHRWARGDWQLLPWILRPGARRERPPRRDADPRARPLEDARQPAPDALGAGRRSPTLVAGWTVLARARCAVDRLRSGDDRAARAASPSVAGSCPRAAGSRSGAISAGCLEDLALAAAQTVLASLLLAHQAWLMADAIARTLVRLS